MYKGGRSVRLQFRCTPQIKAMLSALAQQANVTEADVFNDLVLVGYRERFGQEALKTILEAYSDKS